MAVGVQVALGDRVAAQLAGQDPVDHPLAPGDVVGMGDVGPGTAEQLGLAAADQLAECPVDPHPAAVGHGHQHPDHRVVEDLAVAGLAEAQRLPGGDHAGGGRQGHQRTQHERAQQRPRPPGAQPGDRVVEGADGRHGDEAPARARHRAAGREHALAAGIDRRRDRRRGHGGEAGVDGRGAPGRTAACQHGARRVDQVDLGRRQRDGMVDVLAQLVVLERDRAGQHPRPRAARERHGHGDDRGARGAGGRRGQGVGDHRAAGAQGRGQVAVTGGQIRADHARRRRLGGQDHALGVDQHGRAEPERGRDPPEIGPPDSRAGQEAGGEGPLAGGLAGQGALDELGGDGRPELEALAQLAAGAVLGEGEHPGQRGSHQQPDPDEGQAAGTPPPAWRRHPSRAGAVHMCAIGIRARKPYPPKVVFDQLRRGGAAPRTRPPSPGRSGRCGRHPAARPGRPCHRRPWRRRRRYG